MSDLELELRELSKDQFESLIQQLLVAQYPSAGIKRVDGAGGDGGVDSFSGSLNAGHMVWQCKHFPNRVKQSQRKQISDSITTCFRSNPPASWTLCVPINLRTAEHAWFETAIQQPYGGHDVIKLIQASDILRHLLSDRKLRDHFFPNNSLSNVIKLRDIALEVEGHTQQQQANVVVEYAQRYLEGEMNLDPRLEALITVGGTPAMRQGHHLPNSVFSISEGERTTHFVAKDPTAFNLDPVRFTLTLRQTAREDVERALDTGVSLAVSAGSLTAIESSSPLLQSLFAEIDLRSVRFEMQPSLPLEITSREIPFRLLTGAGSTAREIPFIPFKVTQVGRREWTMISVGRLPLTVTLKLSFPPQLGVSISVRVHIPNADAQELEDVLLFLEEATRSEKFEIWSLDPPNPILREAGNFLNGLDIPVALRQLISSAALVSKFWKRKLLIPEKVFKRDEKNLDILRKMATGEEFFDVNVESSLKKDIQYQDRVLAAIEGGGKQACRMLASEWQTLKLFGQEIETGIVMFEADNVILVNPEDTRTAYLQAEDGVEVPWNVRCLGPCRVYST